jgi:hypothetical protein
MKRHGNGSNAIQSGSAIRTSAKLIRESVSCCSERSATGIKKQFYGSVPGVLLAWGSQTGAPKCWKALVISCPILIQRQNGSSGLSTNNPRPFLWIRRVGTVPDIWGIVPNQRPMTITVNQGELNRKLTANLRRLLIQEERCVQDNLHVSHSAVDGRPGRKFRPRRDASSPGTGHNFDRDELCFPPHIVKLTKQIGAEQRLINRRA